MIGASKDPVTSPVTSACAVPPVHSPLVSAGTLPVPPPAAVGWGACVGSAVWPSGGASVGLPPAGVAACPVPPGTPDDADWPHATSARPTTRLAARSPRFGY